jgi:hypothetical protein
MMCGEVGSFPFFRETTLNQLSVISYQLSDVSFHFTDYCLLFTVY